MSENGHIILYAGNAPDSSWGGTTNKLGGKEKDFSETENWTINKQWQSNTDNHIVANTETKFTIDDVKKEMFYFSYSCLMMKQKWQKLSH